MTSTTQTGTITLGGDRVAAKRVPSGRVMRVEDTSHTWYVSPETAATFVADADVAAAETEAHQINDRINATTTPAYPTEPAFGHVYSRGTRVSAQRTADGRVLTLGGMPWDAAAAATFTPADAPTDGDGSAAPAAPVEQPAPESEPDRNAPDYIADVARLRAELVDQLRVTGSTRSAERAGRLLGAIPFDHRMLCVISDAAVLAYGNVDGIFGDWPYIGGALKAFADGRAATDPEFAARRAAADRD